MNAALLPLALLVDATSIWAFRQFLNDHGYSVEGSINYGALLEALRARLGDIAFDLMFAFVAINPEHEGQQKFCTYLRNQGFRVDETDFRDAFILPKSPGEESQYQRLSTRITYLAGMLTAPYDDRNKPRKPPHLVVVSDAFDLYYPMLDYVLNRGGQATLAFFRRGLEDRWQRAGLFDEDSPIKFLDLSDDAKSIVGTDLGSSLEKKVGGKGLASFKL